MKITDEAKPILLKELQSGGYDCLKASLQKSCCGTSLVFSMINLDSNEKSDNINGVSVLMDDETRNRAETVTIAVKNGELIIQDSAASSCCC